MKIRKWHLAAGVGAFLLASLALSLRSAPVGDAPPPPRARGPSEELAGVASCSGRGCHGSLRPNQAGVQQNEFSTWIIHDRHAHAYDVLLGPRGQQIGKNLGVAAEKDPRCLACHTTPQTALATDERAVQLRSDGVGCEACHGPARKGKGWLEAHVTGGWGKLTGAERKKTLEAHGMNDLGDPKVQARVCVGCHVGAPAEGGLPARDLNHDLMAAGHPRLLFELAAYQQNLPPHWRADKYDQDDKGREARLWAAGQVATARAALELLIDRAAEGKEKPWPEFAEYDCFSCHAGLRPWSASWRIQRKEHDLRPGSLPYSVWHSAALALLGEAPDKEFKELAQEMARPLPDRARVRELAAQAKKKLDALEAAPVDPKVLLLRLAELKPGPAELSWDAMEQRALAAAALHHAARKGDKNAAPDEIDKKLDALFKALAFPDPFESPRDFRRAAPGTKPDEQPGVKEFDDLLKAIRAAK
jgi:hypothetical protein